MSIDLPRLPDGLTPGERNAVFDTFNGLIQAFDSGEMRDRNYTGAEIADIIRLMDSIARGSGT